MRLQECRNIAVLEWYARRTCKVLERVGVLGLQLRSCSGSYSSYRLLYICGTYVPLEIK
jgi:hypothetical protein